MIDEELSDNDDFEDLKEIRKKRLRNKNKHRRGDREKSLRPLKRSRPRPRIEWDPEYDEDDYEMYYEEWD